MRHPVELFGRPHSQHWDRDNLDCQKLIFLLLKACYASWNTTLSGIGHHCDGRVEGVPARRAAPDPRHPVARRRTARRLHRPSHEGDRHAATLHFICQKYSVILVVWRADLDLRSSPRWWPSTVATQCPSGVVGQTKQIQPYSAVSPPE